MFVRHLLPFAAFGLAAVRGPLLEHAGDPGGGGAPAGSGAPAVDPNAADPAQTDPGAADPAGAELEAPDLDGTDDADDDAFVNSLPEANLRTRMRRAQRFRREANPVVNLLRDPQTGKLYPAEHVTRLLANAREFENLDRLLRSDPKLVQSLMDADARLRGGGPPAGQDEHPPFDAAAFEQAWPYEIESKEGRAFFERQRAEAQRTHALEGDVKQLRKLVTGVQQDRSQETFSKVETESKALVFTAAEEVDPVYRQAFITGARAQFDLLRATNRLTRAAMQAAIDRMLEPVRAAKKKQTRTTAARQSEMAAGNGNLPRVPRPGTVQPASGEPTTKRETIKDASKSFLARYAG
jgi:hypothetical protein